MPPASSHLYSYPQSHGHRAQEAEAQVAVRLEVAAAAHRARRRPDQEVPLLHRQQGPEVKLARQTPQWRTRADWIPQLRQIPTFRHPDRRRALTPRPGQTGNNGQLAPNSTGTGTTVPLSTDSSRAPANAASSGGRPVLGARGNILKDCMDTWDAKTHITKQRWREICSRTLTEPHL